MKLTENTSNMVRLTPAILEEDPEQSRLDGDLHSTECSLV